MYLLISFCAIAEGRNLTEKISSRNLSNAEPFNAKKISGISQNPFRKVKTFIKRLLGIKSIVIDYNYTLPFVDTVTLNRTHIITACPNKDFPQNSCSEKDQKVEVTAHATEADGDPFIYDYEVTAGKIVGNGARVIWDLSGVPPGKYEIKIYGDDGCSLCGKPAVMEIKVVECE